MPAVKGKTIIIALHFTNYVTWNILSHEAAHIRYMKLSGTRIEAGSVEMICEIQFKRIPIFLRIN